jgi:hypothetical protein
VKYNKKQSASSAKSAVGNNLREPCENLSDLRGKNETSNSCLLTSNSFRKTPNSSSRVQLDAPVVTGVAATADSFTVNWSAVPGAYSYTVQYSKDPMFSIGAQTGIVNAPLTTYTVPGREPDSIYYVRVKAYPNLPGPDTGSNYSMPQAVRTLALMPGEMPDGDVVAMLQQWMNDLNGLNAVVLRHLPDFGSPALTPAERRRLLGSGVRRYGFIDKVSDTAVQYSQFWPADIPAIDVLKDTMREIEVLRNLLILFRTLVRMTEDRFLVVSDVAFRLANAYYRAVRDAVRRQNPEAEQVWQMLDLFWQRPRKSNGTPTQKKLVSDTKAVASGRKTGAVGVRREKDTFVKGEVAVYDTAVPAKANVVAKETVTEEVN